MSVERFDATRVGGAGGWLLAEGHEPSSLWEASESLPSAAAAIAAGTPAETPTEPKRAGDEPPPSGAPLEPGGPRSPGARQRGRAAEGEIRSDSRGELASSRP